MSYVFQHLPPFAADYSGVASALHDLGGLVVIHDASGCTGSFTGYDEPRWYSGRSSVYCSGLREFDAIMGNDDRLLENIRHAIQEQDYEFVAIIGSPVPMLVGFDFDGFAALVEHETGIPAFGFPTTGLDCYHRGLDAAYRALAQRFVVDRPDAQAGANILGASPLDNFAADSVSRLRDFLGNLGLPLVSVWGQGANLPAMRRAASASINLVVATSALPLAKYMAARWAIPYVSGIPVGEQAAGTLARQIAHLKNGGVLPNGVAAAETTAGTASDAAVLLIGEQMLMSGLRSELRRRYPSLSLCVGSFFAWDALAAETQDCFLANESAAIDLLSEQRFDAVVGDPLLRELLPESARDRFLAFPHYAVSGRLHREHTLSEHFDAGAAQLVTRVADVAQANRASLSPLAGVR